MIQGSSGEGLGSLRERVVGGASWTLAGAVLGRSVSLAGTIIATRLLLPSRFGQLSAIQLVIGTFAVIASLGLGIAVTKRVAEYRAKDLERVGDFASSATKIVAVSSGVTVAIVILGRDWLAETLLHSPELATPLALTSGMVFTSSILTVQTGILAGLEAFKEAAIANSLRSVLTSVLLVTGIGIAGINGGLIGGVVGEAATILWVIPAVFRSGAARGISMHRRGDDRPGAWASLRQVGLPALAASVAILLSLLVGQRMLLEQPGGFAHVAQFSVAYKWSMVVLFIPSSAALVMLPLLSNLAGAKAHIAFRRLLRTTFVSLSLVTAIPALIMIVSRDFVLGLSGGKYESDSVAFVILMAATIPITWNTILSQSALALDAIRAWLVSDVVLALTLGSTAFLLIPRHHAAGLASAYAVGYVATCVVLAIPVRVRLRNLGS